MSSHAPRAAQTQMPKPSYWRTEGRGLQNLPQLQRRSQRQPNISHWLFLPQTGTSRLTPSLRRRLPRGSLDEGRCSTGPARWGVPSTAVRTQRFCTTDW